MIYINILYFLKHILSKGIITLVGEERFQFTPAIDLFLAYYEEIIKWGRDN